MNLFKTLILSITIIAVALPACAQDGGIGSFDIDKVYEDAAGAGDDDSVVSQGGLSSQSGAYPRRSENYAFVLLRIIGYLVVVTVIILAAAWGARRLGVAGVSRVGGGNNMDTIEAIYFGQNRGAVLIRVADTVYLLGHTPESVVLLEKIEGEKAVELIASSKGGSTVMSFKDAFNNFMGKMKR
ncbi:MAG: flagellar biosynthetic protein FliO [Chitinispirillales bacterium]|jgi:flagellar biogenesis protein FliO|nr:flagellar biosynthetic protein FliO [Chitinispirillales bacterium]